MKILVLNGPNLNMTGKREAIYGAETLDEINARIAKAAKKKCVEVEFFQSNGEGAIIDKLQAGGFDGLIINAGAYTHYSYAISDALYSVKAKKIEVHMTNILAREEFRKTSVISKNCDGAVMGLGADVYLLALEYLTWGI
ncbi:MAG: type II 3-dehydroquinate dehydratase [Clostridiales bacterium]|nr:type II 3-dehydroquinate dehydratase [Clostridiales bacterium]